MRHARPSITLIRARFPRDEVGWLDQLADLLRAGSGRRIPRAALIRALVQVHLSTADDVKLAEALAADLVKPGREKKPAVGKHR